MVNFVTNFKMWLIPLGIVLLSFLAELLSGKMVFFNFWVATILFWVGMVVAGLLASLEIFSLFHTFISERFMIPSRKLKDIKDKIEKEQKEIDGFLDFDIEKHSIEELKEHLYILEETHFSKEALTPYLLYWYAHIDRLHTLVREDEEKEELKDFENQKKQLQQDIKDLNEDKKKLLATEDEQEQTDRKEFLEEHQECIYIDATDLTEEQKRWLEEEDYRRDHQWCIHQKDSVEVMIKPRHNESLPHAYLTGAVHQYVKEFDSEAQLPTTKTADVIFTSGGIQWAIEIETGKVHEKNKKQLIEKVKIMNEKFPDRWFFVVTNKNLLPKYRKFGKAVDRRSVVDKIDGIFYPEGMPEPENTP